MAKLTVAFSETRGGFNFRRSDGEGFFIIFHDDGSADLYAGANRNTPPQTAIVHLDASVQDKGTAAEKWILAYPTRPTTD